MARPAQSESPNTAQREGQPEERWWRTPAVIAAVIAALAAISVAIINQRGVSKPKSPEPTTITQQTHGPASPVIAHVEGPVNCIYGISEDR
jgi:hypothetical protein